METLLIGINAKYIHSNLAIRCLDRYAQTKSNYNIKLVEYTINQPLDLILREILKIKPDIIGFSCYIWNYEYIKKLVVELKKLLPKCHIFLGGPEVSFNACDVLAECGCDSVICGEGEAAFVYLLDCLHNGEECERIIQKEPVALDDIPNIHYDFELLENRIIYFEASRGCPFQCQYCLSGGSKVRFLSLERVFADLKIFIDAKVRQVKFIDRTFNCKRDYCMSIWKFIADNDNGITNFHFEIAAELLDNTMIEFLQSVRRGLFQFEIGVQSTNPPTLKAIKRITDMELLTDIVARLQKNHNIHLHLDLIAGLPYEGYAEFASSFNFVYSQQPDQFQLGFLKLLKGSGLYANRDVLTLVHTDYAPYEIVQTGWLSHVEIARLKLVEELVETYYNSNRFKRILQYFVSLFTSSFDFFERLSIFYESKEHHLRPHGKTEYYDILWDFANECLADCADFSKIAEMVRYDIYSHEKANKLPVWLNRELSENDKHRIYQFFDNLDNREKYLSEYVDFDTKQLLRNAHIEIFRDVDGVENVVLFNYRHIDILGNATNYIVNLE